MSVPHLPDPPDPDRPRPGRPRLTAGEQDALRRIEDDLGRDDPGFAHRMRAVDDAVPAGATDDVLIPLPRSTRGLRVALVVAALVLLVVVPPSWWVLYLLLALVGAATWVLLRGPGPAEPDRSDP